MLWLLLCYTACFLPFYLFVSDVKRTISQSASHIETVQKKAPKQQQQLGHSDALARTYDAASASATAATAAAVIALLPLPLPFPSLLNYNFLLLFL